MVPQSWLPVDAPGGLTSTVQYSRVQYFVLQVPQSWLPVEASGGLASPRHSGDKTLCIKQGKENNRILKKENCSNFIF